MLLIRCQQIDILLISFFAIAFLHHNHRKSVLKSCNHYNQLMIDIVDFCDSTALRINQRLMSRHATYVKKIRLDMTHVVSD